MTSALDFFLLPLLRQAGKDRPKLPGLYAADAPRRAARGRSSDRFFIYLTMDGNAPLSPKELDALLSHMAELYFKSAGSATAAMRSVAERLNELLLKRNMNSASRGRQAVGVLMLGVIRNQRLYLLQSGTSQAYLIFSDRVQQFYDPAATGRGLGLSRVPALHFHQAALHPGDVLLVSSNPPLTWNTTTLRNLHGLAAGDLYHRLVRRAAGDIEAVMLLAKKGQGQLRLLTPRMNSAPRTRPASETAPPKQAEPRKQQSPPQSAPVSPTSPRRTEKPPAVVREASAPTPEKPPQKERKDWIIPLMTGLQTVGGALLNALQQLSALLRRLFARMLPDEQLFSLPRSTMAFGAIAVPLMVVTVAVVVYAQRGQGRYYEDYLAEAQWTVEQAQQFEHASEQRIAWQAALDYLDMAEKYRITEDSQSLRNYASVALDSLDMIDRLIFQPLLEEELPQQAHIRRIVATRENELYLLDEVTGSVYRAVAAGNSYQLDPNFACGPVPGPLIVGPLMDIAALPTGYSSGAAILGMDGNGNLVQCIPGSDEQLSFSMLPPSANWGTPTAFAMDAGDIYILDPLTSSVWVYDGATEFRDLPHFFFGDQVPPSMQEVRDLTVSDGRLYLLYDDGHLVTSMYNQDNIVDPQLYADAREGFEDSVVFAGANFDEIQFAPPPDPSIYMLDGEARAIYHFSLQMVFKRQYRPQSLMTEEPATAFTVGPKHQVFMVVGNQVYAALLP